MVRISLLITLLILTGCNTPSSQKPTFGGVVSSVDDPGMVTYTVDDFLAMGYSLDGYDDMGYYPPELYESRRQACIDGFNAGNYEYYLIALDPNSNMWYLVDTQPGKPGQDVENGILADPDPWVWESRYPDGEYRDGYYVSEGSGNWNRSEALKRGPKR